LETQIPFGNDKQKCESTSGIRYVKALAAFAMQKRYRIF